MTIVELLPQPLGGFDPDLVDRLVDTTRELGADIYLDAKVTRLSAREAASVSSRSPMERSSPWTPTWPCTAPAACPTWTIWSSSRAASNAAMAA